MILVEDEIYNLKTSKLEMIIDRIEMKIQNIFDRINLYELRGKPTYDLEQHIEKLMSLLAIYEYQYYRYSILVPEVLNDEPILKISDILSHWERGNDYVSNYNETRSVEIRQSQQSKTVDTNSNSTELKNSENKNDEDQLEMSWLEENAILGSLGEDIALSYLNKCVSKDIKSVSDQAIKGYDLEWNQEGIIKGFEIKTSKSMNGFHITLNELKKALLMKENYNIFFINVNKKNETVKGTIINDPIYTLEINLREITKNISNDNGFIQSTQFYFTFSSNFIENRKWLTIEIPRNWWSKIT